MLVTSIVAGAGQYDAAPEVGQRRADWAWAQLRLDQQALQTCPAPAAGTWNQCRNAPSPAPLRCLLRREPRSAMHGLSSSRRREDAAMLAAVRHAIGG